MTDDPPRSIAGLGELLDHQAEQRPDDLAVTDGTRRLTWRGYRDASARLAGALVAGGVIPGDRVAILLPKSVDSFVAVHAILRIGAVVVPIDWFAPTGYVSDVVSDAGASAIVSTAEERVLDEILDTDPAPAVIRPSDVADDAPAADRVDSRTEDDAYIVYTSGSTGRPKGIVHTHASGLAYARAAVETYELDPSDRLVNVAPLHFDQSTFELYAAPLAGAAVVVLSDVMLRFPASASDLVARERATVWYSVPYAISQLTSRGAIEDRDLSSMRWVLFGGESFQPGALASAMNAIPGARFSNVYGPAEVNQCTRFHLDAPPTDDRPVPIGDAWAAADLRIVARDGTPTVDGESGELLVSTPTMMDRYWNRPELTAASIVDDSDGARWYRTGDLVTRRDDGQLVFLGRADHQVKLRGHRIELEAVEAVACEHDAVDDCAVVVVRGDDGEDDRLVALVSPARAPQDVEPVIEHIRRRLPRYAVPAGVESVESIPRSRTGKIDRTAARELLSGPGEIDRASGPGEGEQR